MTAAADADVGAPPIASRRIRALLFAVLAAVCWGSGTVLSKAAVAELPPLTLLAAQLAVSVVIVGLAAAWRREPASRVDRRLVLLGAANPGLAYALSLIGLTMITASSSVLVWAMEPLLIVLVAGLILGERPGRSMVVLSLAAFGGLVVAIGAARGEVAAAGLGLSLAGVLCCVAYSVATRRWIAGSPSTLRLVLGQDVVALLVVGLANIATGIAGSSPAPTTVSVSGLISTVASGVLYYGAAYVLYLDALRVLSVSVAAISFYLVPVFGIAAATLAGETLGTAQWLGATTTIAAVLAVGAIDVRRAAAHPT